MKTLYAITHVNPKLGLRQLTFSNQGRNHFETPEAAQEHLDTINPRLIAEIFGPLAAETLEVRPVECYDHGDAVGIYFD